MARCSSCGAPIFWGVTINGKLMPIDNMPTQEGNVRLTGVERRARRGQLVPQVRVLGPKQKQAYLTLREIGESDEPRQLFMPHHATCPSVAAHRGAHR